MFILCAKSCKYLLCAKNGAKELIENKSVFQPQDWAKSLQGNQTLKRETALQSQSCCDGVSNAIQKHTEPAQPSTMTVFQLSTFIQRKGVSHKGNPELTSYLRRHYRSSLLLFKFILLLGHFHSGESLDPIPTPMLLSKSIISSTCSHLLERCSGKFPSHRIFTGILVASPSIP